MFPTHNLTPTQAVYAVALNFYGNDWTDTQDVIEDGKVRREAGYTTAMYGDFGTGTRGRTDPERPPRSDRVSRGSRRRKVRGLPGLRRAPER